MRRCSPGTSSASGYSHYELYRRLVDFSSVASVGSSASRCRSCQHEKLGLRLKRQEKCAFSFTEDHFPGRDMGLNVDAGAPVTGTFRVHPVGCGKNKARPVTHFQTVSETVRSYGSSIQGDTFGLLHMRPLQWWLRTKGFSPRGNPFCMIKVTRRCLRDLVMWKKPWFLSQGPMLGASCRRKMLTTDASLTGWGAISEGRSSQGLWKDHHLSWRINRLDMLAVFLALKNFLTDLRGHHVRVRSDNTSVVSYINHQGGLRSRPLCKLACQILLWSQRKLLSLRATCIPGAHNIGADILSRQGLRPGEWRLHPEVVELMCKEFGQAQVDLFASRETSHCPLWFSLTYPAPLGLDAMTQMWPRLHLYAFPPIALLPGVLERVRRDRVPLLLIAPRWPGRVWFPNLSPFSTGLLWSSPSGGTFCPKRGARYFTPIQNYGNCGLGLWGGPAHKLRSLNRGCWDHSPLQSSIHEETACPEVEGFRFLV